MIAVTPRRVRFMVLLAVAPVLAAAPQVGMAASRSAVTAQDDQFVAPTITVDPGGSVTWTNHGKATHNVVADDGSFASATLAPGQGFSQHFPKVGQFKYYCSFHGSAGGKGMAGVVLVGESPGEYQSTSATRTYPATPPVRPPGGRVLRVPSAYPSIQAAVDATRPGDLVLVGVGTYHEAVKVTTDNITIRGADRNRVVLDGQLNADRKNGIAVFGANGVVIENMTATGYALNGFYWRSVWGYRGSYLTAYDNGDYGIYAFDSGVGMFDHSYAGGNPDSGFYIGQCHPCNALITDVISHHNALGYSWTNAGGNLVIRDSEWSDNMGGIGPNTLDSEALAPERGVTIVNNWVHGANSKTAPANASTYPSFGYGVVLGGGSDNEVAYNLVEDQAVGIASTPNLDANFWIGHGNRVHDNTVGGSTWADVALMGPAGAHNCYTTNNFHTSLPPAIEQVYGCSSLIDNVGGGDLGLFMYGLGFYLRSQAGDFPRGDWKSLPAPAAQPVMPAAQDTGQVAAAGPPSAADVDGATAVARAAGLRRDGAARAAGTTQPGPTSRWVNLLAVAYGYLVPLLFLVVAIPALFRVRWWVSRPRVLGTRRLLIGLPLLYLVSSLGILAVAYLN